MEIKISAIIPVYNTEKYLNRCLDSVCNQSLKEIEIIIVNDGSPDRSIDIIEKYQSNDERIRVINKKNGGISSARNAGIEIATGKYIINIDSDDWVEKNYFEDMYNKAEKKDLDIVVTDFLSDNDNGEIKYKIDLKIDETFTIDGEKYLKKFFLNEIYAATWNKMYKLNLYKEYNIRHPNKISLGEDLATTPLLASKALKIGKINKAYYHYIHNINSITNSEPTRKIYELIEAFEILEKGLLEEQKKNINSRKIIELGRLVFNPNYDLNNEFYK